MARLFQRLSLDEAPLSKTLPFAFSVIALAAFAVGCGGSAAPPNGHDNRSTRPMFVVSKSNGVYLGAQVNPSAVPSDYQLQETETEGLEMADPRNIGRRLALHNEYRDWLTLSHVSASNPDPEFSADIQYGRVPVIALQTTILLRLIPESTIPATPTLIGSA